jgi:hypothetical protein
MSNLAQHFLIHCLVNYSKTVSQINLCFLLGKPGQSMTIEYPRLTVSQFEQNIMQYYNYIVSR